MITRLRILSLALVLALPAIVIAQGTQKSSAATLDGKTFVGEVSQQGKDKPDPDEISFKAGKMHSTACDPYGFTEAEYKATATGDAINFTCESTSPKEGKMSWKGVVKGDTIEGVGLWTKDGQPAIECKFSGKLKK